MASIASMQCKFPWTVGIMRSLLTPITISVTPTLINRVVLSLKKTADNTGGVSQAWNTTHFATMKFEPRSMGVISGTATGQPPDDPTETRSDTNDHNDIPLDEFIQRVRPQSLAKRLRVGA